MTTTAHKITSTFIRLFSKKPKIFIPDSTDLSPPLVLVANHERLAGPIMMDTYFPLEFRPWIIDKMLIREEIIKYVGETFFAGRLKMEAKISYTFAEILAPLIENVMNSTNPIPVFQHHHRLKETFQLSIEALKNQQNLLIFPEKKGTVHANFRHVFELNTGFLYLAKQYFRDMKQTLRFYPVSVNPNIHTIAVGKSIQYNPHNNFEAEKKRLCHHLMTQIEDLYIPNVD